MASVIAGSRMLAMLTHMNQVPIVVPADDTEGSSQALAIVLSDDQLRTDMGARALHITVPDFTWERRTRDLLDDLGVSPTAEAAP